MFLRGIVEDVRDGKIIFRVGYGDLEIALDADKVTIVNNGIEVPDHLVEKDPWLKLAAVVQGKRYEVPVVSGDTVKLVAPVVYLDDNVFLGYKIVAKKDGTILDVLDAGKYRKITVPGLGYDKVLPVENLANYESLSKEEKRLLAANTPPELIPIILYKDTMQELAGLIGVEKLRRDPMSLLELDKEHLKKLLQVATKYWMEASPEANPATIEMLIEELRSVAPEATPELNYLYERLREEKHEEKQIERMKKEQEETFEEWERRLREEQTRARVRQTIREIKAILNEVLGVTLPVIVKPIGLGKPVARTFVEKTVEEAAMTEAEKVPQ